MKESAYTAAVEPRPSDYDPRLYMAAERTYLAWLRTGIALMGFGFVVARFGLFLRELPMVAGVPPLHPSGGGASLPAGIGLIALGMLVNLVSGWRHARYIRALDEGNFRTVFGSRFAYLLGTLLGVLGIIMAIYLSKI